jgi:hypothetical protein
MSDVSHKMYILSLKSVGHLVRWSPLLILNPKNPGSSSQQAKKKNKKLKFYQAIRNQNQIFHGFNSKTTTETSNRNFARDFEWPELRVLQKTYEIPPEVSVQRKPEKFSKFRAKKNYCVHDPILYNVQTTFNILLTLTWNSRKKEWKNNPRIHQELLLKNKDLNYLHLSWYVRLGKDIFENRETWI